MSVARRLRKLTSRASSFWRSEEKLKNRLVSVGHLLSGNLAAGLIGFVAFALTARALGPGDYGILVLVYSYARVIERIVSFQSWQPLIKYGAALSGPEQQSSLKSLLKFGLLLDIGAAALSWVVAIGVAQLLARYFGWSAETLQLIIVYATVLLFQVGGMPTAVMRLAGRFKNIAYWQMVSALVRLTLCAFAFVYGGGLLQFVCIWAAAQIFGSMSFLYIAFRQLRKQNLSGVLGAPLKGITTQFPGLWNFALSANLSLTIRTSAQEFDTLIVGALADPASAGLYHIAKRLGRFAQQIGAQVQAVLYPDVARLWANRLYDEFRRTVYQVEALLAIFGIGIFVFCWFFAELLIGWTAGSAFSGAAPLLVVQSLAIILTLTGASVRSALLAVGRQQQVLTIVLIATAVFHAVAFTLVPRIGPMGANVAHIALGTIWIIGLTIAFRRAMKDKNAVTVAPQASEERGLDDIS